MSQTEGILTPEAVLLDFSEAGLGSRAIAFAIDLAVRLAVFYAFAFIGAVVVFGGGTTIVVIGGIALVFALFLLYPMLFETFWNGRTPGKAAMGLRVVTVEGAPVRIRHSAIRAALAFVDTYATLGAFGITSALVTRRSQRLGDLAAGTMVIRERQAGADSMARAFHPFPGWEDFAGRLDVSMLDAQQYGLIRSFLIRVLEFDPASRIALGRMLAERTAARLGVSADATANPEAFLVAVCAAYQWTNARGQPVVTIPPARGAIPPPVDDGWRTPLAPGWGLAPVEWR